MVEELCLLCVLHHRQRATHSIFYPILWGPLLFQVHRHGLPTPAIIYPCWQEQVSNPSSDFKISSRPAVLLTVPACHLKFCILGSSCAVLSFSLLSPGFFTLPDACTGHHVSLELLLPGTLWHPACSFCPQAALRYEHKSWYPPLLGEILLDSHTSWPKSPSTKKLKTWWNASKSKLFFRW